jgi:NADPH:quinone reductase-like Zn-dependent oxidoreductase
MAVSASANTTSALWYRGPKQVELRQEVIPPPGAGEVRVKTLYSASAAALNRSSLAGAYLSGEFQRMRAPFMAGDFPFPVKYGYAAVGQIENSSDTPARQDPSLRSIPHQTAFNIPAEAVVALPEDVPPLRAVLAANMETALNGVWDAAPGPADRIAVVGAGVVGSLVAYLCGRIAGTDVTLVDINSSRAELAGSSGLGFAEPGTQKPIAISLFTPAARRWIANGTRTGRRRSNGPRNELVW